ncbi:shikimate dehydrogenase family protein, partial [Aeropyrum camini]
MIRLALFGSGVGSSLSPAIYTGFARGRGLRLEYRVYEAGPGGLAPALEAAGDLHGFNVTKPLKREALRLAARLDQHARAIGAVNTMVAGEEGWEGFNTDWRGFLDSLRLYTASPPDKALVIGAGGAGRAAAYALATWGA